MKRLLRSLCCIIFLNLLDGDHALISPYAQGQNVLNLKSLPKNVTSKLMKMYLNTGQPPWAIEQKLGRIARPELLRNWNAQTRRGILESIVGFLDFVWQDTQFLVSWLWEKRPEYFYDKYITRRMCFIMQQSYRSSLNDVHRYSELRQWYTNTAEFEIGYLVQESIFKYELMIEIYDLVYKQFTKNTTRNYTPVPYMLEMYRNMLEHAADIIHVSALLHTVEAKYKKKRLYYKGKSMWSDYEEDDDDPEKIKLMRNPKIGSKNRGKFVDINKIKKEMEDREIKRRKDRQSAISRLRRNHLKWMANRYKDWSTTKKKYWQENYGWSIEDW